LLRGTITSFSVRARATSGRERETVRLFICTFGILHYFSVDFAKVDKETLGVPNEHSGMNDCLRCLQAVDEYTFSQKPGCASIKDNQRHHEHDSTDQSSMKRPAA
jgi:hypothetical protein